MLFGIIISLLITPLLAYFCQTEVRISDENIRAIVDCDTIFEICCSDGCCPRFSHAHIWLFAAGFFFILFMCLFGCWLYCCKSRNREEGRVDASPLTLVIPEVNATRNASVPVTPPPSYEEATAMR